MAAAPTTLIVFGGSFSPPHTAHVAVAEAALDAVENGAENGRVLWMPAATPPHKQDDANLISAEHRLAMVRLATAGNSRFEVSDLEILRGDVSYTVDTLRALKEEHSETELALLIGGDSLTEFATWREPEAILELAQLMVYERLGATRESVPEWIVERTMFLDAPPLDVSSTALRASLRSGRSVRDLVPDNVLAYIEEHGMYG